MTQINKLSLSLEPFICDELDAIRMVKRGWKKVEQRLPEDREIVIVTVDSSKSLFMPIEVTIFFNFTDDNTVEKIIYGLARRKAKELIAGSLERLDFGTKKGGAAE